MANNDKLKELSNEQITQINNRIYKHEDLIGEIIKYLDSNVDNNLQINDDELVS
jgi:ribosomal protein S13